MSIVNNVLLLLKIEVKEEMRADIITASINPLSPVGIIPNTNLGKAIFEQPARDPHTSSHLSGSPHPTVSEI